MSNFSEESYKKYITNLVDNVAFRPSFKTFDLNKPNLGIALRSAQNMITNISFECLGTKETAEREFVLKTRFCQFYFNVLNKHSRKKLPCFERGMMICREHTKQYIEDAEELKEHLLKEAYKSKLETPSSPQKKKNDEKQKNSEKNFAPPPSLSPPSLSPSSSSPNPVIEYTLPKPRIVQGLQVLEYPADLVPRFLSYCVAHVQEKVEFCGILCGKKTKNGSCFEITHCLLPEQECTEESVNCLDEMSLFRYQMKHSLLTLGWIHVHPTQRAFLSSIDIATHFGYQQMLKEAIAVVCAPTKVPDRGFFRIQEKHMPLVEEKMKRDKSIGNKFVHLSNETLFENAPHVEQGTHSLKVVDLRKKKGVQRSKHWNPNPNSTKNQQQQQRQPKRSSNQLPQRIPQQQQRHHQYYHQQRPIPQHIPQQQQRQQPYYYQQQRPVVHQQQYYQQRPIQQPQRQSQAQYQQRPVNQTKPKVKSSGNSNQSSFPKSYQQYQPGKSFYSQNQLYPGL